MAMAVAVSQSCGMCFIRKSLRTAIIFEARRGYGSAFSRKMRYSTFLLSRVSKLCYRTKRKFTGERLDKECVIPARSKSQNKVSVLMHYDNFGDLFAKQRGEKQSEMNLKDEVDVSLACKIFPSIKLGSSPPVELYDETACNSDIRSLLAAQSYEEYLPNSTDEKWVDPVIVSETKPAVHTPLPDVNASIVREDKCYSLPLSPQTMPVKTETIPKDLINMIDSSKRLGIESQSGSTSTELLLDRCVSCLPGLSKRLCRQLENYGFHTLRKLLHHFPRTYADLQNAQVEIEDGQYLIFIGTILSSRGIRAGCSFSFLEVVVGCEIADNKATSGHMDDKVDSLGKKTIYLHLKKFFRGSRFSSIPFLRSLEGKHQLGDFVCVSGKVLASVITVMFLWLWWSSHEKQGMYLANYDHVKLLLSVTLHG